MLQALFRGRLTGAAIALVIRQVVVMGLGVGSSVAVSRWLGPEVVGRFAILIFVTQGILGYFGDLGLKAALIRKRGDLEPTELATAQKVILGISLTFAVVIGALLPLALRLVKLGPENYLPAAIFCCCWSCATNEPCPSPCLSGPCDSKSSAQWKRLRASSTPFC